MIQAVSNTEHLLTQYISQQLQFKGDTVKPSVPAPDFNLKAYAAIKLTQMIRSNLALNPDHVGHCSQVVRTVTLPIVPPGQTNCTIIS